VIVYDKEVIKNCNKLVGRLMGCEKDALSSLQQRKTNGTSNGEIKTPNGMQEMMENTTKNFNIFASQTQPYWLTYNIFQKRI
jgi:hypothetical protein